MPKTSLAAPSEDDVMHAIKTFDEENLEIEWLLDHLFAQYPRNTALSEVSLKTRVLNLLYSTRILAVDIVAQHITGLPGIDEMIAMGAPEAVDQIAYVKIGEKIRCHFSFASKYCSWHNPEAYPIYDSRAEECLWQFERQDKFAGFRRYDEYKYAEFVRRVTAFRNRYELGDFSFKQLDKYLYSQGNLLLAAEVRTDESSRGVIEQDS